MVSEQVQLEIILAFGLHTDCGQYMDDQFEYWRSVSAWLAERYPELMPCKEYPRNWQGDLNHEKGMIALRDIHKWQQRELHKTRYKHERPALG